ncbi:signal peptidase I, partial [Candidatus Parcubacteria bacterium]|nr:signal peptidase I [Candidatus Parcubacteria bacterium]
NFQSLVVMSGSMEPEIHTGSVVIVRSAETLAVGDVITFARPDDPKNFITHRIESIEDDIIKTKGDANNAPDNWEVRQEDVQGKVAASVPHLGYAVHFAKTQRGFVLLILLPALLIILDEIWAIKKEMEKKYEAKLAALEKKQSDSGRKRGRGVVTVVAMSALGLLSLAVSCGRTSALFSDTVTSSGNTISAGVWETAETSVVLNEFLPNPSGDDNAPRDNGEWVELYNNSSEEEFDLGGWYLYDSDDDHELEITSTNSASYDENGVLIDDTATTIPAKGFLLVYRNGDGDFALNNTSGDSVRLYNGAIGGSGVYEVDAYEYTVNAPEDKSFARDTDGTGDWVDPIPTPGGPNEMGEEELPEVAGENAGEEKSQTLETFLESDSEESLVDPPDPPTGEAGAVGGSLESDEEKSPTLGTSLESDSGESAGSYPSDSEEPDDALGDDPPEADEDEVGEE